MIFIDFETRNPVDDLKKVGAYKYAQHAEPLCLAYAVDMAPVQIWIPCYDPYPGPCPTDLYNGIMKNSEFAAHNATFEWYIWNLSIPRPEIGLLNERYGTPSWPALNKRRLVDTAAMAAAVALPRSLADCAEALGLRFKKDSSGKRLINKFCKPRKKLTLFYWNDKDFDDFCEYCKRDVEVEREIYNLLPKLSEFEQEVWRLTLDMNDRGLRVDHTRVFAAHAAFKDLAAKADSEVFRLTEGTVNSVRQVVELCAWLRRQGVNVFDVQAATVRILLAGKLPADVRQVLELRQEVSRASNAKYESILDRVCENGRVRDNLMYHGAAPGRWTGSGMQIQNFPKGDLRAEQIDRALKLLDENGTNAMTQEFGGVAKALSSCLRAMIVPAEGKEFICSDLSAIEARVLAWIVGDQNTLDKYWKGVDLYVDMAARIYKIELSEVTKVMRQLGKVAILGLGYGMGTARFELTCKGFGIEIDKFMAQKVVDTYRETCSLVPKFWREIENQFKRMTTLAPGQELKFDKYSLKNIRIGMIPFIALTLPSGRKLYYCDMRLNDEGELSYVAINGITRKWELMTTWGGVFTENVVQAIARDILAEVVVRCNRDGWNVVTTVHDEILCEEPIGIKSVDELNGILSTPPKWAQDLPLAAEGWKGNRYKK